MDGIAEIQAPEVDGARLPGGASCWGEAACYARGICNCGGKAQAPGGGASTSAPVFGGCRCGCALSDCACIAAGRYGACALDTGCGGDCNCFMCDCKGCEGADSGAGECGICGREGALVDIYGECIDQRACAAQAAWS